MKSENTREEDKSANIPEAAPTDTPAPPTANKKKNNITKITQKRKPAKKRPIKRNHNKEMLEKAHQALIEDTCRYLFALFSKQETNVIDSDSLLASLSQFDIKGSKDDPLINKMLTLVDSQTKTLDYDNFKQLFQVLRINIDSDGRPQ